LYYILFLHFFAHDHPSIQKLYPKGMDYQGADYGSNNANQGGGFSGGMSSSSQRTPSRGGGVGTLGPRKAYNEQTLIPVTCRMILAATSTSSQEGTGALALTDGRPLHHIRLVGAVRSVETLSTNMAYEIEDGTGLIEVKQWMDDNDCSAIQDEKIEAAREAQYVCVIGQVKDYDGKKSVVAHSIRKVQQGDMLTHHLLQVVYSAERHLKHERIGGIPSSMNFHHVTSPMTTNNPGSIPITANQPLGGGRSSSTDLHERVMHYFKTEGEQSPVGAPIFRLVQQLAGMHREDEIRAAVDYLATEGHIYSTINEENYKFAM
jgi:replication factor A2